MVRRNNQRALQEVIMIQHRNALEHGKIYYSLCPDNPKRYRSIRLEFNAYTQSLRPQISNAIEGVPPPELEQISPVLLQRLMKVPSSIIY